MTERVFLDTNVLVYVFDGDERAKQAVAARILEEAGASGRHVLSTQILEEFYVTVTRKLAKPLSHADAQKAVAALALLPVVQIDAASVVAAVARAGERRLSLWDALVVQSAVEGGCTTLLTEDLQHGQTIDGVRVENPFREG